MKDARPWNSHENAEQYDCLFPLLPDYVAHYTIGGKLSPRIGLPDKNSLHLAEDMLAMLIANQMGISLAYAKKRYAKDFTQWRWLGITDKIDRIYKEGRDGLGWYASFGLDLPKKDNSFQDLSMQFFFRNLASLDAAKRLSELGYLCEVATILRSALEQCAFCAELWQMDGSQDLKRLKPNRSLGYLKKVIPAVGNLYGLLSKYTHFEYDHHTHFLLMQRKRFSRSSEDQYYELMPLTSRLLRWCVWQNMSSRFLPSNSKRSLRKSRNW